MGNLRTICRELCTTTGPKAFKRIAGYSEAMQVTFAIEVIRDIRFVRSQFTRIFEFMEEEVLRELRAMNKSATRCTDWVEHYVEMQRQYHDPLSSELTAVSGVYAATHNSMKDRLEQLEHPAIETSSVAKQLIAKPSAGRVDVEVARSRFYELVDGR